MWRMRRGTNLIAHAVIEPASPGGVLVGLFVNGQAMRIREFDTWDEAIAWSDRMRDQNWAAGWRLISA